MKKTILTLFIAFLFFAHNSSAQTYRVGAIVGGQVTKITGDDLEGISIDSRVTMYGGFYVSRTFNKVVLQTEIMYSDKGVTFEDINERLRLTYLDIPIVLKYYVFRKMSVIAGPQVGLLFHGGYEDEEVSEQFKPIDFGLVGGIEFDSNNDFYVGVRYNYGLVEIGDNFEFNSARFGSRPVMTQTASKFSNRSIQAYISFNFNNKKDKNNNINISR